MSRESELEKMSQAQEYFHRYYELVDAVKVSKDNKEYLKTYLHDSDSVSKQFNVKSKILSHTAGCFILGIIVFAVLFFVLGKEHLIIAAGTGALIFVMGFIFEISLNKIKLSAAQNEQREINDGINEQISMLDGRIKERERLRDDYANELKKRVDFISLDYIKYIDKIKELIENGEAETCEEAVSLFEQKLILKQMNDIMEQSEKPISHESDKERFGDPLELIKKNKKKKGLFSK